MGGKPQHWQRDLRLQRPTTAVQGPVVLCIGKLSPNSSFFIAGLCELPAHSYWAGALGWRHTRSRQPRHHAVRGIELQQDGVYTRRLRRPPYIKRARARGARPVLAITRHKFVLAEFRCSARHGVYMTSSLLLTLLLLFVLKDSGPGFGIGLFLVAQ